MHKGIVIEDLNNDIEELRENNNAIYLVKFHPSEIVKNLFTTN